jgi:hypothetical protein
LYFTYVDGLGARAAGLFILFSTFDLVRAAFGIGA